MREINHIIEDIIEIIENTDMIPVDAVVEYRGRFMDMPLSDPTVTVGINDITLECSKIRSYGGRYGNVSEYSIPAQIELSANIYIPKDYNGLTCYDVLTQMANGLFYNEKFNVYKIKAGNMTYNSTFLCVVLPVSIFLNERVCGNSVVV